MIDKNNFKEMKISVECAEHSTEIQNALFEMGYSWGNPSDKQIKYEDELFLYTSNYGSIMYDSCPYYFERQLNKEYIFENSVFTCVQSTHDTTKVDVMGIEVERYKVISFLKSLK